MTCTSFGIECGLSLCSLSLIVSQDVVLVCCFAWPLLLKLVAVCGLAAHGKARNDLDHHVRQVMWTQELQATTATALLELA